MSSTMDGTDVVRRVHGLDFDISNYAEEDQAWLVINVSFPGLPAIVEWRGHVGQAQEASLRVLGEEDKSIIFFDETLEVRITWKEDTWNVLVIEAGREKYSFRVTP